MAAKTEVCVEDSGERGIGRVLVIRCAKCGDTLARHQWARTPPAEVMYRTGLDDGAVIQAHGLACGSQPDEDGYA